MIELPDLESLRCFVLAATHANFRTAARKAALSPAAFGARIRRLEERLGQCLFRRTTRRVALTVRGAELLPQAKSCIEQAVRCAAPLDRDEPVPFDLVLGSRFDVGLRWVVPAFGALERASFSGRPGRCTVFSDRLAREASTDERRSMSEFAAFAGLALAAAILPARSASAQVIEPNGVQAPQPAPADEISIQEYFDAAMEPIDALADASAEPGAFSPLCDFTATIVLAEAMSADGLSWYNVPASPTALPTPLYSIIPESTRVTGQIFTGADIRNDANYAGGLIGFALTQNGSPIYYSEYQRNANCTQCSMPGHWKMMLAYRSVLRANAYYLGFEDWAGANASSWGDNDGDFQDKMFLVTGITCAGGGEPCDTGMPGLCAAGLTECAVNGTPTCKQQQMPKSESCDNADNDCNGLIDDGDLCDANQICVRGKCVARCNTGEFACPIELVCGTDGFCIDPACLDVTCAPGLACRNGACVGACDGIVCPLGQVCRLDRCIDPCVGVACPEMTFCHRGVCVGDCTCNGCPSGEECAPDGQCVAPGCAGVTCPMAEACRAGACVPRCEGAVCPGRATCQDGACGEPPVGGMGGSAGLAGASGAGGTIILTGGTGAGAATGGSDPSGGTAGVVATGGSAGSKGAVLGTNEPPGNESCACRSLSKPRTAAPPALLLALAAGFALRRRRGPRRDRWRS